MTLHAIAIPKWGLSMEEGTLAAWLVKEGAKVAPGDEIAEIETTKITNVLEASVDGVLRRQVASPGELRKVGALIGVIADADEDDAAIAAFVGTYEPDVPSNHEQTSTVPEPQVLKVDGHAIRFQKAPAKGAASGAPLLLLHGFGGDHLNWLFNQAALASTHDVYALDLPGHGASTKDVSDGSFAALAERVLGWMDAAGLTTVHLVGHSMGAGVALTLALASPTRVISLVSICGAGFGGTLNRAYVDGFIAAQNRKQLSPVVALLFAQPDLATREMLDDLAAYKRIDGVPEALRRLADGALSDASLEALTARRAKLTQPALAIYADQDQVMRNPDVSPAGAVMIENSGHLPQLEAAATINVCIAAFVQAND